MIAGLILSDSGEKESHIAFLGDETRAFSFKENKELLDKIEQENPGIVAVNSGSETVKEELSEQEEELKDEGFAFTPSSSESRKIRRLQALKAQLDADMGEGPKFIRFDPYITSEKLAIHGDEALESFGVDVGDINSAGQFDAVLGAVTARFYQQDQFRDLGVVVPQNLDGDES